MIKGAYVHPDQLEIGNITSEDRFLAYMKGKGGNTLNLYARSFLSTDTGRTRLNAFVNKAKLQGFHNITVDIRSAAEVSNWETYYNRFGVNIDPLTEREPWIKDKFGLYDYAGCFAMLDAMQRLRTKYGCINSMYVGWMGNNYSNPTEAVEKMVSTCERIYISNYVSTSDFLSIKSGLGAWDNRMDKRCIAIAAAARKLFKQIDIVEIVSLEPEFCYSLYSMNNNYNTTGQKRSFYGTMFNTNVVTAYNQSTPDVLQWTKLIGRTMFFSKYMQEAQP